MKKSTKLCSLLLALVMVLSVFSPVFTVLQAGADTILGEIRLTSSTTSVQPGTLPAFSVDTSDAHITSIDNYSSSATFWSWWGYDSHAWQSFGLQTPIAVNDGKTHYALCVSVNVESGYAFGDTTKIYFNGTDVTSLGHTCITALNWGGYVYIDLGTAGAELAKYTVTYSGNGGTGTTPPQSVYQGESLYLRNSQFTPPAGMSFKGWNIEGVEYEHYAQYKPTHNVTATAVWTDVYIRESRATMTPASLSGAVCANDLVFASQEPSKYTVLLWRVYDETDKSLNTAANQMYPFDKKFVSGHEYAIEIEFRAVGNYYEYDEIDNISTFYLNGVKTDISKAVAIGGSRYRRALFTASGNVGYTVSFNAGGGSGSMASVSGVSGSYSLPACGFTAPSGKEFKCWSVGGVEKAVGATISVTANTTVTAVWKEKHVHNYNQVMCNEDYHWYECACGARVSYGEHVFDNDLDTTCNVCGYIRKVAASGYTVTFYANGGSGSMQAVSNVQGNYTLPACSFTAPAGQKFSAWAIGTPTGPQCMANTSIKVNANTAVYAVWVANSHTHSYSLEVIDATCTEAGCYLYTCTGCGYSYKENEVPALGHLFEREYTYSPQATDVGYTQHTCARCRLTEMYNYTAPTGKLTLKCSARTAAAEKLVWNYVDTANGYQIQISNAAGTAWSTYATLKNPALNSYVFKSLAAGTNYKFRVRFYIYVDGKNYFSPWSAIASPTLPAATTVKATAASKAFTAQWGRKAATGYQIQYGTKANFSGAKTITVKNAKTYKYAVKSLKAKTTYYVRIRTYKTIGKVNYFSTWSSAVKVKTK